MRRAIVLVLDSFGIGSTDDADAFGDAGANTLGSIAAGCAATYAAGVREQPLTLPNLTGLGLMHAASDCTGEFPAGCDPRAKTNGTYGFAAELSNGKDTPSGHWEMAGVPVLFDWGYFSAKENSVPESLLAALASRTGVPGFLGNCHRSGTVILDELGEEHMRTGKPIIYTSADSVCQIAAHEETFGLDRLLSLCDVAPNSSTNTASAGSSRARS